MVFWDCNMSYGIDTSKNPQPSSCLNIGALKKQMRQTGVTGGWIFMAFNEVTRANEMLAEGIKDEPNLYGIIKLLPPSTCETPSPKELPAFMKAHKFAAATFSPRNQRFMMRKISVGDYLEEFQTRKIPVVFNTNRGVNLDDVANIMEDFPALTAILTYANCWPSDRELRPFVEKYPNLHLDMSYMLTDDGLREYPAGRILFGSAYPESYMGAHMMVIKHANISEEAKNLIAGGNLLRIMEEAVYD